MANKILIDCRYLGQGGGIAEFFNPWFDKILQEDRLNTYFFLCFEDNIPKYCQMNIIKLKRASSRWGLLYQSLFQIQKLTKEFKIDKFFSPYYDFFFFTANVEVISTVHDFAFYSKKVSYNILTRVYFLSLFLSHLIFNSKIILISHSQLNTISRYLPNMFLKKFLVIRNNLQNILQNLPHDEIEYDKKNEIVISYMGGFEQRKDIKTLFTLFQYCIDKYGAKCVCTGYKNDCRKFLDKDFDETLSKVTFKGYLNQKDITKLYQDSSLILYPSLYEGFGRPIAEAFFYKKPIVCKNLSVYKEFFSNFPYYADSIDDFKYCIDKALSSNSKFVHHEILDFDDFDTFRNMLCSQ